MRHVPIGVVQATFGWPLQSSEEKSFIKIVAKNERGETIKTTLYLLRYDLLELHETCNEVDSDLFKQPVRSPTLSVMVEPHLVSDETTSTTHPFTLFWIESKDAG